MPAYESVIIVRISGLDAEADAHTVNEAVGEHLQANLEVLHGDLSIAFEVNRYDPDNPDAEAVTVWPTAD